MNQVVHHFDKDGVIEQSQLVTILARLSWRPRVFAIILAVSLAPVLLVFLVWPSHYETKGTVIVGNLDSFSSPQAAGTDKLGDPADLESQILIARSSRMIRLALERPGVVAAIQEECRRGLLSHFRNRDCSKLQGGSEDLLNYVMPRYTVRAEGRSRVISMGYRSSSARVAFILANALIVTYLEDQRAENGQAREEAIKWLLKPISKASESNGPTSKGSESKGDGKILTEDAFYKNLHSKATDFETERRTLPNPSRLVSFAEMPGGPASKLPLLAIGLIIAAGLAGFVATNRGLSERVIRLCFKVLPARWALWVSA